MRISDLIIIYLACGAPFAVYFYLQNRQRLFLRHLFFKTVLNFIFWIPLSSKFLLKFIFRTSNSGENNSSEVSDVLKVEKLNLLQKNIEQSIYVLDKAFNLYEIREILNRYTGLSLSVLCDKVIDDANKKDFFQIANGENNEIGAMCLERRNHRRLLFHQKQAATDFFEMIANCSNQVQSNDLLKESVIKLSASLEDIATENKLSDFFARCSPTGNRFLVNDAEKILWNSLKHKPLNAEPISVNLHSMTRTNSQIKD